jgi:hypothetical protein
MTNEASCFVDVPDDLRRSLGDSGRSFGACPNLLELANYYSMVAHKLSAMTRTML